MKSNKKESVGAVMEVPWLVSLLLLLAVPVAHGYSQHGLTCVNDYINNITCMWNSSGTHPRVDCVLQGKLTRYNTCVSRCDLKPMEDQRALQSCHLVFKKQKFYIQDRLPINVTCGNYVAVRDYEYEPVLHVKMPRPGRPVITKSNITFSLGSPHSTRIKYYYFQLQFKRSVQLWQNVVLRNLTAQQMSAEIAENQLEKGGLYEARVRVKPTEDLEGVWSSWSPTASWRSEVGRTPDIESLPGPGPELQVTLGLLAAALALLVLITCKFHQAGWVYKLKLPYVPNPSTYFQSLNSVHGGNFQKWLSPMFPPESFNVAQSFDDISTMEVLKAKGVVALLHGERASDPTASWDRGPKCPGSYNVEVCPVYVGSKSGAEHSGDEGGGEPTELQDTPLQVSCAYQQLGGESRPLEPGCREQNEEEDDDEEEEEDEEVGEEEEEDGEFEDGLKEMDALPPLTILPLSLPGHVTPAHFQLHPHLPSIPLLPFPFCDFDSGAAPGSSNATGPPLGARGGSSFAKIEPCSGGYMSVQNARCNNSL